MTTWRVMYVLLSLESEVMRGAWLRYYRWVGSVSLGWCRPPGRLCLMEGVVPVFLWSLNTCGYSKADRLTD